MMLTLGAVLPAGAGPTELSTLLLPSTWPAAGRPADLAAWVGFCGLGMVAIRLHAQPGLAARHPGGRPPATLADPARRSGHLQRGRCPARRTATRGDRLRRRRAGEGPGRRARRRPGCCRGAAAGRGHRGQPRRDRPVHGRAAGARLPPRLRRRRYLPARPPRRRHRGGHRLAAHRPGGDGQPGAAGPRGDELRRMPGPHAARRHAGGGGPEPPAGPGGMRPPGAGRHGAAPIGRRQLGGANWAARSAWRRGRMGCPAR